MTSTRNHDDSDQKIIRNMFNMPGSAVSNKPKESVDKNQVFKQTILGNHKSQDQHSATKSIVQEMPQDEITQFELVEAPKAKLDEDWVDVQDDLPDNEWTLLKSLSNKAKSKVLLRSWNDFADSKQIGASPIHGSSVSIAVLK